MSQEKQESYKALHIAPALNSEDDSPLCISGRGAGSRGKEGNYVPAEAKQKGHQLYPKDKRTAKEITQKSQQDSETVLYSESKALEKPFFCCCHVLFFFFLLDWGFFKQNK